MNRVFYPILLLFFLFSCKNDKQSKPIQVNKTKKIQTPTTSSGSAKKEQVGTSAPAPETNQDPVIVDAGLYQPVNHISKQFKIKELDPDDFTNNFKGRNVLKAYSWEDTQGENTLIITRTNPVEEKDGSVSVSLYAIQFLDGVETKNTLWDIYDFENNCEFDLWIGLIPNSLRVTDLDADGISETTFVYKKSCRSDYSPSAMKLIMHEGDKKMALRGWMFLPIAQEEMGINFIANESLVNVKNTPNVDETTLSIGRYKNEVEFAGQPKEFRQFARKHWQACATENKFTQFYGNTKITAPIK